MLFVTPLLKNAAYPTLSSLGYFRSWRTRQANPLTVLTYHGVFPEGYVPRSRLLDGNLISAQRLHRQLSLLKRHYNVICPEEFFRFLDEGIQLPPRAVLLTCDDGLANVVSDMLPVLEFLQLKCIFFLTGSSFTDHPEMLWYEELWLLLEAAQPGSLGFQHFAASVESVPGDALDRHRIWWELVKQLSKTNAAARRHFIEELGSAAKLRHGWKAALLQDPIQRSRFQLLDKQQAEKLVRSGMTVGAHTMDHPVLAQCTEEIAREEIAGPLKLVPADWNMRILAYPFGTHETVSARDASLAEAAGYHCAFMNVGGSVSPHVNRFAVPRIHITADMKFGEFEAHASGFHQDIQNRLSRSVPPVRSQTALSQS
ncbi:MAG TPA: polysaccharide deacetylase family protein [Terriglobales bacterium]|jgi:peptidoglycan/xylan/chitin deacetylase (PgdA/CDA1 family)